MTQIGVPLTVQRNAEQGPSLNNTALAQIPIKRRSVLMISTQFAVLAISAYFFLHFLPAFRPFPYADDWIYADPLQFTTLHDWVTWLFMQHVDHRIPVQKLISYFVLRSFGFDFRYLVGVNYLLALLMTYAMLYVARHFRGYQSVGDLIIPLINLQYAAGFALWAFQFQFLLSVLAIALFTYFYFRYEWSLNRNYLMAACAALLTCSLSGVNGLIAATWATIAFLSWLIWTRALRMLPIFVLLGGCLIVQAILWLSWRPSGASDVSLDPQQLLRFIVGLLPSSMSVYSFTNVWWKSAAITILLAAACMVLVRDVFRRKVTSSQFFLLIGLVSSLLIIISVSLGRAKA